MANTPDSFSVAVITSAETDEAYTFHVRVGSPKHIWLRTEAQIRELVLDNNVFGIRRTDTSALVGLCYLKPEGAGWELGGLLVSDDVQRLGIGTLLARLVLTYAVGQLDIFTYGQPLIAHVHEANLDPRGILQKTGFVWVQRIVLKGTDAAGAPSSMRNAAGEIVGDELRFTNQGVRDLAQWLNNEFDGTLERSGATVQVNFGFVPLGSLAQAVKEVAESLP